MGLRPKPSRDQSSNDQLWRLQLPFRILANGDESVIIAWFRNMIVFKVEVAISKGARSDGGGGGAYIVVTE